MEKAKKEQPEALKKRSESHLGRPPGTQNKATKEIREAAKNLLARPEYRESLKLRLDTGEAPHMETLLHHYAFGKPKERLEVTTRTHADILSGLYGDDDE